MGSSGLFSYNTKNLFYFFFINSAQGKLVNSLRTTHRDTGITEFHAAGYSLFGTKMQGIDTHPGKLQGITGGNSASCHDFNTASCKVYGMSDIADSFRCFIIAARGEYAGASRVYDVAYGLWVVGGHVNGPVEGRLHTVSSLYKEPCAYYIDSPVGREYAYHHARGSCFLGVGNVV